MFKKTYINTVKNLFRSPLFWMLFSLFIVNTMVRVHLGFRGGDSSPDFDMSYFVYLKLIPNALGVWVMQFSMPFFAVISTMLAINGDYKNSFYEIEKAADVNPVCYVTGRLAAIVTINFTVMTLMSYLAVYGYCITRGLYDFTANELMADSIERVFRLVLICETPVLLFYIGLTYVVTALLKNGRLATVTGCIYCILMYLLRGAVSVSYGTNLFGKYFWPLKINAYFYVNFYDTEHIKYPLMYGYMVQPTREVALWVTALVSMAFICYLISYICTRKRQI